MDNFPMFAGSLVGCYALALAVVFLSGGAPTKWQTWPVVHGAAWVVPIFILAGSVFAAIPGLAILFIIVAATTRG